MTKPLLPIKLNKEPLIDAIFELRFISQVEVSEILPGIFFSYLQGNKSLSLLPASQLPKAMRDKDPSLIFAHTTQIVWANFLINIGNRSVAVNCKLPYSGWIKFKEAISQVLHIMEQSKLIECVERCSIKYIDLLESTSIREQIGFLNFACELAGENLDSYPLMVRVEKEVDGTMNIVQLMAAAKVQIKDTPAKEGIVVDVDTIIDTKNCSIFDFVEKSDNYLEHLHAINKKLFFDCLNTRAIEMLEPIYE
ncbi:MAG: TIGR04255 family protein [Legionellales bacterium]|nr:TIGR04255 family protein [Legionellales bacterium]